eukprot:SAG31_NODE_53_length_30139_cov_31.002197_22_plen_231_part_00
MTTQWSQLELWSHLGPRSAVAGCIIEPRDEAHGSRVQNNFFGFAIYFFKKTYLIVARPRPEPAARTAPPAGLQITAFTKFNFSEYLTTTKHYEPVVRTVLSCKYGRRYQPQDQICQYRVRPHGLMDLQYITGRAVPYRYPMGTALCAPQPPSAVARAAAHVLVELLVAPSPPHAAAAAAVPPVRSAAVQIRCDAHGVVGLASPPPSVVRRSARPLQALKAQKGDDRSRWR